MKKKLSLNFGNFAIARPVYTTCYLRMQNNKQKSRKLELMCDINLNEKVLIKIGSHFFPVLLPKIFIKNP